jgi:hypothetical protein
MPCILLKLNQKFIKLMHVMPQQQCKERTLFTSNIHVLLDMFSPSDDQCTQSN